MTPPKKTILAVDDEEPVRIYLKTLLGKDFEVFTASDDREAFQILEKHVVDVVLLDLMLKNETDGMELLRSIRKSYSDPDIIILSGVHNAKTIVATMKEGATDYITKPFEKGDLLLTLERVFQKRDLKKQNQILREELGTPDSSYPIVGISKPIQEIKAMIQKLRGQEVNVFLVGETGTGKEVFARLLHHQESEPTRPFVSVNCAAIPENLLESVLFGHEKGAFTGATESRIGKFELANGGDIFLDEISCLTPELQAKLLRVLEEKEVERIGSKGAKKIRFRVISASNENILKKVAEGLFRSDLFYRLNTVTIQLPSLNDRREDIVPLAEHFLKKFRRTAEPKTLSEEVKEILSQHDWRGNVRELRNTVENMIIFSKDSTIHASDVPFLRTTELRAISPTRNEGEIMGAQKAGPPIISTPELSGNYKNVIQEFERELFLKSLERNRWSKTKTCKEMGISRNKLYRKLSDLGIEL